MTNSLGTVCTVVINSTTQSVVSREALENTEMFLATARTEGEDLIARLKSPEHQLSLALGLRSDVALLEQHETESKRLTRELQRIERGLPNVGESLATPLNCIKNGRPIIYKSIF